MASWSFRKQITVAPAKAGADLTNFPVLVHLDNEDHLPSADRSASERKEPFKITE